MAQIPICDPLVDAAPGAPRSEQELNMATSSFETIPNRRWRWPALRLTHGDGLRYAGLAAVVALVLPQLLAGVGSVIVLYHLVRRWFGTAAGLLAGLVLAVMPVAIAVERNNTPDATLIFTLLLANLRWHRPALARSAFVVMAIA